jgi:beta-aspartyl-peptidase (threonine type)
MENKISIAIHGGAGTITPDLLTPELEAAYHKGLRDAMDIGYEMLAQGASSLEAVIAAVTVLEDCELFNAGKGSVFTNTGTHEMDASLMYGKDLSAAAVSSVSRIKNPIQLCDLILKHSDHVYLNGDGALQFAQHQGMNLETDAYFFNQFRYDQWQEIKDSDTYQLDHKSLDKEKKFGTVGAVALDSDGHIAAATSTGGMTNKKYGRVGDSPIIGSGTYANDATCAISCTGHGEYFIRSVVAYDISCLIEYKGLSLEQACNIVVKDKLVVIGGEGGLIGMDRSGVPVLAYNSAGMYRGARNNLGLDFTAIYGV